MKKTSLITSAALLTFAILCVAPPMASASGSHASAKSVYVKQGTKSKSRWWNNIRKGNFKKQQWKKTQPKNKVDTPEPVTGLLALAAAGAGGAAMRRRKKGKID